MLDDPPLILASASPRRHELLTYLGRPFEVRPADVDETLDDAVALSAAERLAALKAATIAGEHSGAVVVGSDTIVVLDGRMLTKPASPAEAGEMLRALRGRDHEVITGVAVARDGEGRTTHCRTVVRMREYSGDEIKAWIGTGEPFDKAGAYAIQDPVFRPVERIEGCACNVIGLPLWTLRRLLATAGLETQPPALERCANCPDRGE